MSTALGIAMAVGAAALFSVNGTVSKIVLQWGISSVELVKLRSVGAAACLLALVAAVRPSALRVSRRELGFLALFGITGIALVQWFYFVAIERLPVGIALLLEFTAPLFVALWVRFVRRETVRRRMWAALALCLAGLALVAQVRAGEALDVGGVIAGVAAAIALAAYFLLGERGLTRRDPLSLAAWSFAFSALLWSTAAPSWRPVLDALDSSVSLPAPFAAAVPLWSLVGFVVVLGTVVPYVLVLGAIGRLGPARVGLIGTCEPVGASLVAWIVLGEVLSGVQLAGGAVVLAGIVLAETSRRRTAEPDAAPLPEGVVP